ncbi:hypothetical protein [Runella sp.]|uniref:hypothetical protein n=1 Tax=Runella sp. TaxID=1960881 RepID=UPI003D0B6C92
MIRIKDIQPAMTGLVGFRPSFDTQDAFLTADLLTTSSGLYVDGMHPLLTLRNIEAVMQASPFTKMDEYDAGKTYKKGQVVANGDKYCKSLQDSNTNHPVDNGAWWEPTTLLAEFLRRKYADAVSSVVNSVIISKKTAGAFKSLLIEKQLFHGEGSTIIAKQGRFVGFQIKGRYEDVLMIIQKVGIQLSANQTLTLYLYHSSQAAPIGTVQAVYTNTKRFQYVDFKIDAEPPKLTFSPDAYYTLGYYESDLTGTAYDAQWDFLGENCSGCGHPNAMNRSYWNPYVAVRPIAVTTGLLENDKTQTWLESEMELCNLTNWGLNLIFGIHCDITDPVIRQKENFAVGIAETLKVNLLQEIMFTLRNNKEASEASNLAFTELGSESNKYGNPHLKLQKVIDAISFDFSGLSGVCLPCNDVAYAVRTGAI